MSCRSPSWPLHGLGVGPVTSSSPRHEAQPACRGVASSAARCSSSASGRPGRRGDDGSAGSAAPHTVPATAQPGGGRRGGRPWTRSCPPGPGQGTALGRHHPGAGNSARGGRGLAVCHRGGGLVPGCAARYTSLLLPVRARCLSGGAPRPPQRAAGPRGPRSAGLGALLPLVGPTGGGASCTRLPGGAWWPASPRSPSRAPGEDGGARMLGAGRPLAGGGS